MSELQRFFETRIEEGRITGCYHAAAAAMGMGDQVLASAFTGQAPLPGGTHVDAHTRFDMAALSKVISPTMIALKAMENDELGLDERVGDFFPEALSDKRNITVEWPSAIICRPGCPSRPWIPTGRYAGLFFSATPCRKTALAIPALQGLA